ncbi:phage tail tube protein [Aestuariibius insulae]|uniref:phage tail tube protein n=1 Tax=Aestuariibius insulae TaxID=2058287 RepID=UPI00345EEBF2
MARAQGARSQMAAAFETTYGLPPLTGFRRMPFATSTLSETFGLLENELLGYGRDPLAPSEDVVSLDGDIVIPMDTQSFGLWLKATFGEPATTGSGAPYTHTFESGSWELPSLSIETGMPEVPSFAMAAGNKVDTLSFTMQRQGQLQATLALIGQGENVNAATSAGTPTPFELTRFVQKQGNVERDGTRLANVVSAQLTYRNNLDRIETLRNDGKIEGVDPSMAMLTGNIVVRFADKVLLDQAINGEPADFEFSFTRANESLTFAVPRIYLPKPRRTIEGPQGIQATFDWQAAKAADGGPMITATLVNAIESY